MQNRKRSHQKRQSKHTETDHSAGMEKIHIQEINQMNYFDYIQYH